MITINLLPKSQRKAERSSVAAFPYQIYLVTAVAIFLVLHLGLLSFAALKKVQLIGLEMRWKHMGAQAKGGGSLKSQIKSLETSVATLRSVMSRKVNFTEFFSGLSGVVPRGMWLERFSLTASGLVIQGSVVSQSQGEMTIIGKFLQDLKARPVIIDTFAKVDLISVQRRMIKTYDVVDFVIEGKFK
jgi:Tfp pilus assembly protein PilN